MLKQNVLQNSLTFFKSTSGRINKFSFMQILHHQGAVYLEPQSNRASIHLDTYGTVGSKKEKAGEKKKKNADAQRKRCVHISSASYMTALGRYWQALKAVWSEQQVVFYKWQD